MPNLPKKSAISGKVLRVNGDDKNAALTFWSNSDEFPTWKIKVKQPGKFKLTIMAAGLKEAEIQASLNNQTKNCKFPNTGAYGRYKKVNIGNFNIAKAGRYQVILKPVANNWNPTNFKKILLTQAK